MIQPLHHNHLYYHHKKKFKYLYWYRYLQYEYSKIGKSEYRQICISVQHYIVSVEPPTHWTMCFTDIHWLANITIYRTIHYGTNVTNVRWRQSRVDGRKMASSMAWNSKSCCKCNKSGTCKGCACTKASTLCVNCLPGKLGCCQNRVDNQAAASSFGAFS